MEDLLDGMEASGSDQGAARPPEAALEAVEADLVAQLARPLPDQPRILRAEQVIPPQDLLAWLAAQPAATKLFWHDRSQEFEVAAVGAAHCISGPGQPDLPKLFAEMQCMLRPEFPSARYYGGFAFAPPQGNDPRWQALGGHYFALPCLEIVQRQDETRLACNVHLAPDADSEALRRTVRDTLRATVFSAPPADARPLPGLLERADSPDAAGWSDAVNATLDAIARGEFQKAVLARETRLLFENDLDPTALLRRLLSVCARSFGFMLQPCAGTAFLGASPERLYKRRSCYVQTEAIAGTRPRGADPDEDYTLGKELLASDKDRREHRFVVESIEKTLDERCRAVKSCREPSLLKLRQCQHLHCTLEGVLKENERDAALLDALHPTPAVGGVPQGAALEWIANHEPFDRWWFAAPVGWVSYDAAEFLVAIRSGLASGPDLSLYTGAGIVAGSVPESEWEELENKMSSFIAAFGAA